MRAAKSLDHRTSFEFVQANSAICLLPLYFFELERIVRIDDLPDLLRRRHILLFIILLIVLLILMLRLLLVMVMVVVIPMTACLELVTSVRHVSGKRVSAEVHLDVVGHHGRYLTHHLGEIVKQVAEVHVWVGSLTHESVATSKVELEVLVGEVLLMVVRRLLLVGMSAVLIYKLKNKHFILLLLL